LKAESPLGQGAFAWIYKGAWRGEPCAIKRPKKDVAPKECEFLEELEALSRLEPHENIVGFKGKGTYIRALHCSKFLF
jgi:serine/threonine protein kinase